jgi:hypothetical protein
MSLKSSLKSRRLDADTRGRSKLFTIAFTDRRLLQAEIFFPHGEFSGLFRARRNSVCESHQRNTNAGLLVGAYLFPCPGGRSKSGAFRRGPVGQGKNSGAKLRNSFSEGPGEAKGLN